MRRACLILIAFAGLAAAQRPAVITDAARARALKQKYVALTDSWAADVTFRPEEQRAMEAGRQWEPLMMHSLDDPLAKKILAAGEPSFERVSSYYPGKVLDRTVLGTYSDPGSANPYPDEFAIYWNGAIAANLLKGRLVSDEVQPVAHNTVVLFRVGSKAEIFGTSGNDFTRPSYELGYLPLVTATYEREGVRYQQTAFADLPAGETRGWDVAWVQFELANASKTPRVARLFEDLILIDGTGAREAGQNLVDAAGAILLSHSDPNARFDEAAQRVTHEFRLNPGERARICLKIPYLADSGKLLKAATSEDFAAAHRRVREFWAALLERGARIQVPEERVNNVWRALLLQNFILADGPKFTYGSGLRYNDSTYPQENGFGAHTFALYGHKDYAAALQPHFVGMSVTREGAGRKYQNRRAMVLHHLLETYRLTGRTTLFERFKNDYYRVAEEIIADRHSTMAEQNGVKPLHWGLLPPDKPGVDIQASTQTVYVLGHNITNCQGLQDFGQFLLRTGVDRERGRRYVEEAREFRKTLLAAMERAAIRLPDRPPFVDLQTLYFRQTPDYGPAPYDDLALGRLQGTYFHYWVDMEFHYNFFNPSDQVGRWLADYVAQRGGFVLGLTRSRRQLSLPGGWINNVYDGGYYNFRLRGGEIDTFLLGFYARTAFGMSQHLYVASEGSPFIGYNTEKGGFVGADYSFPNSAANADTLLMLRNMLVLEELDANVETGDIFLLKGAPRAWFEPGKEIKGERLPTYFGDLSFTVTSAAQQITASIQPPQRDRYRNLILHLRHPQKLPMRHVRVNGRDHSDADLAAGVVRLLHGAAAYRVEVTY